MNRIAEAREQIQPASSHRRIRIVDRYFIEEGVDRPTQRRQRFQRPGEILLLNRLGRMRLGIVERVHQRLLVRLGRGG